jgi:hypothetical protein
MFRAVRNPGTDIGMSRLHRNDLDWESTVHYQHQRSKPMSTVTEPGEMRCMLYAHLHVNSQQPPLEDSTNQTSMRSYFKVEVQTLPGYGYNSRFVGVSEK